MIGKLANVIRRVSIVAVDGSSGCTREIAEFTYCSVWNMSTYQLKKRSISADPRLVVDRTSSSPGTLFTASSTGRVTVTIIWSIGITPLSTASTRRGKLVVGKTATGMLNARYPPSAANVRIRKISGLECRANQYEDSGRFNLLLPRYSFSSFPSGLASAAVILLLSGRPYAPDATILSPA